MKKSKALAIETAQTPPIREGHMEGFKYKNIAKVQTVIRKLTDKQIEPYPGLSVQQITKVHKIKLTYREKVWWRRYRKAYDKYARVAADLEIKQVKKVDRKKEQSEEYRMNPLLASVLALLDDDVDYALNVKQLARQFGVELTVDQRTEWKKFSAHYKARIKRELDKVKRKAREAKSEQVRNKANRELYPLVDLEGDELFDQVYRLTNDYQDTDRNILLFTLNLYNRKEIVQIIKKLARLTTKQKYQIREEIQFIQDHIRSINIRDRSKLKLNQMDDMMVREELNSCFQAAEQREFKEMTWKLLSYRFKDALHTPAALAEFSHRVENLSTTRHFSRKNKELVIGYIYIQSLLLRINPNDSSKLNAYRRDISNIIKVDYKRFKALNDFQLVILVKEIGKIKTDDRFFTQEIKEKLTKHIGKSIKPKKENKQQAEKAAFPKTTFRDVEYPGNYMFFQLKKGRTPKKGEMVGVVMASNSILVWDSSTRRAVIKTAEEQGDN